MDIEIINEDGEIDSGSEIDVEDENNVQETKKNKQSKATIAAKILNDFAQKRLEFTISHLEKEFQSKTNILTSQQKDLKKELVVINPASKPVPKKGLVIPQGLTKKQVDKFKKNHSKKVRQSNLSMSLKEYDDAKKKRDEEMKEKRLADSKEDIEQRTSAMVRRGRRGAIQLDDRSLIKLKGPKSDTITK
ncbi:uncharacterized protein [Antedon mediterranea]|uniref:uncharacterized protein n=1 Tax=Antedon mediterranea TaxID=105859 RepID=UPI003AF7D14D